MRRAWDYIADDLGATDVRLTRSDFAALAGFLLVIAAVWLWLAS